MIQSSEKDLYHSFEVDVRKKGVVVHGGFIWMSQCDSSQTHLSSLDPCSSPLGLTTELCRWPRSLSPLNLFPRGSVDGSALLNHGIFILSSSICRRKFLSSQEKYHLMNRSVIRTIISVCKSQVLCFLAKFLRGGRDDLKTITCHLFSSCLLIRVRERSSKWKEVRNQDVCDWDLGDFEIK